MVTSAPAIPTDLLATTRPAHSLRRSSWALMATTAVNAALGLLFWVVAARLYPARALGLGAASVSALQLLGVIGWVGLQYTVLRYVPAAGRQRRALVLGTYAAGAAAAVAVSVVFVAAFARGAGVGFLTDTPRASLLFLLAVPVWVVFSLQDAVLTAVRRPFLVLAENTAYGALKLVLLVLLAGQARPSTLLAVWVGPAAVAVLVVNGVLFRRLLRSQGRPELPSAGAVARFSAGHTAVAVTAWLPDFLVSLLVLALAGQEASAYYFAAWTVGFSARLLIGNVANALTAEAAYAELSFPQLARAAMTLVVRVVAALVVVLTVGAESLLRVFGDRYAAEGAGLLRCVALSLPFAAVIAVALAVDRARQRFLMALLVTTTATTTSLLLDVLLIPRWGVTGAGVGWLIGQAVGALVAALSLLLPAWLSTQVTRARPADDQPVAARRR